MNYRSDYHRRLRDATLSYGNTDSWEPDNKTMRGGSVFKNGSNYMTPDTYKPVVYRSGNGASYNMYDRTFLNRMDRKPGGQFMFQGGAIRPELMSIAREPYEEVEGGTLFRPGAPPVFKKAAAKVKKAVKKETKSLKQKVDVVKKAATQIAKDPRNQAIAKKAVAKALDIGIPAASSILAGVATTALGAPGAGAPVGAVLGVAAREGIKQYVGIGRGVGNYTPGMKVKEKKLMDSIIRKLGVKRGGNLDRRGTIQKLIDNYLKKGSEASVRAVISAIAAITDKETGDSLLGLLDTIGDAVAPTWGKGYKKDVHKCVGGGAKKSNPWINHVMSYHKAHSGMSYKEAMKESRASYKK